MRDPLAPCLLALASCVAARTSRDTTDVRVRVTVHDQPGVVVVARPAPDATPRPAPTRRRWPPAEPPPTCGFEATPDARMPAIDEVSLGHGHTCARLQDGTVRCWGWNLDGQTGDGSTGSDRGPLAPAQVPDVDAVTQVCAGFSYTCALRAGGASECWGNNTHNQIRFSLGASCTPRPVRSPVDRVRALSCGGWHVCAIRDDGAAWCWGEDAPRHAPWRVAIRERVVEVASGWHRSCARTRSDRVFCWTTSARAPVEVTGFASPPAQLAVAERHACALTADGRAACWGDGYHGELGNGAPLESPVPQVVPAVADVVQVAAHQGRACALTRDGALWCWGDNERGRVARDADERIVGPTRVASIGPARQLFLGERHACARSVAGPLCCWGSNAYGELGNNRSASPDRAEGPSPVVW